MMNAFRHPLQRRPHPVLLDSDSAIRCPLRHTGVAPEECLICATPCAQGSRINGRSPTVDDIRNAVLKEVGLTIL